MSSYTENTITSEITPPEPIHFSPIKTSRKRTLKVHGAGVVTHLDAPTTHAADAFLREEDINLIVKTLLSRKLYSKAALFTFGINTGYRCGDLIAFRVKDFYDSDGEFKKVLYIREDKTNKARKVYINQAARLAIETAIVKRKLAPESYVFQNDCDCNRKAYLVGFKRDEGGFVEDIITSGEKYDENGNPRQVAPMLVNSVTRWLKRLSNELGIQGHYSSHAIRKTFDNAICRDFTDNRNVVVACYALGHSDIRTTLKHYMAVDPVAYREKCLNLNLGLQPYLEMQAQKA